MTINRQDNSKGPRPGKAGSGVGKFGPGFSENAQRSAAQDTDPKDWANQGTCGGDTVADPWYGENGQQPGN